MTLGMKKYKNQIERLKILSSETPLHPLRKEQIKAEILGAINGGAAAGISMRHVHAKAKGRFMVWITKYSAVIIAGFGLVAFTAFASNSAKPGDVLFPVKKVVEQAQIALSPSVQSKAELQAEFAQRRLQELSQVAADKQAPQQFKAQVAQQTQTDINNAIHTLDDVHKKLEDKGDKQGAQAVDKASQQLIKATEATQEAVTGMGIELNTEDTMPAPPAMPSASQPALEGKHNEDKHNGDKQNQNQKSIEKNGVPQAQQDSESGNMAPEGSSGLENGFNFNMFIKPKD